MAYVIAARRDDVARQVVADELLSLRGHGVHGGLHQRRGQSGLGCRIFAFYPYRIDAGESHEALDDSLVA